MQALWLVCTGFASFRHTEYCTNIRQQPDYDEPAVQNPVWVTPSTTAQTDGNTKTRNFANTMQPVTAVMGAGCLVLFV